MLRILFLSILCAAAAAAASGSELRGPGGATGPAGAPAVIYARVHLSGTLLSTNGPLTAERAGTGIYRLEAPFPLLPCVPLLSIRDRADDVTGYADSWSADPGAVWVAIWRQPGTPLNANFDLVLHCPQPGA